MSSVKKLKQEAKDFNKQKPKLTGAFNEITNVQQLPQVNGGISNVKWLELQTSGDPKNLESLAGLNDEHFSLPIGANERSPLDESYLELDVVVGKTGVAGASVPTAALSRDDCVAMAYNPISTLFSSWRMTGGGEGSEYDLERTPSNRYSEVDSYKKRIMGKSIYNKYYTKESAMMIPDFQERVEVVSYDGEDQEFLDRRSRLDLGVDVTTTIAVANIVIAGAVTGCEITFGTALPAQYTFKVGDYIEFWDKELADKEVAFRWVKKVLSITQTGAGVTVMTLDSPLGGGIKTVGLAGADTAAEVKIVTDLAIGSAEFTADTFNFYRIRKESRRVSRMKIRYKPPLDVLLRKKFLSVGNWKLYFTTESADKIKASFIEGRRSLTDGTDYFIEFKKIRYWAKIIKTEAIQNMPYYIYKDAIKVREFDISSAGTNDYDFNMTVPVGTYAYSILFRDGRYLTNNKYSRTQFHINPHDPVDRDGVGPNDAVQNGNIEQSLSYFRVQYGGKDYPGKTYEWRRTSNDGDFNSLGNQDHLIKLYYDTMAELGSGMNPIESVPEFFKNGLMIHQRVPNDFSIKADQFDVSLKFDKAPLNGRVLIMCHTIEIATVEIVNSKIKSITNSKNQN